MGFTFEREVARGWKRCVIGLRNDYWRDRSWGPSVKM